MEGFEFERRKFLQLAGVAALAAMTSPLASQGSKDAPRLRKALKYNMFPKELSDQDKFKLAAECGFEGIDGEPHADLDSMRRQADLARKAGVPIHGIVFGGWHAPFSAADPAVREKGQEGMRQALRCANAIDADTVLLVPAIVNEEVSYAAAYDRSQEEIRKLLPLAEEMKVVIAIENVWNKFLLSPLEFARYIDEFDSRWVKAYFDIGNVVIFGYPEHWIRTLGKRIVKLDAKDFKREGSKWTNLGDGDVNWQAVCAALDEIGFRGWFTAELEGGDRNYLCDVADRMQRIVSTCG